MTGGSDVLAPWWVAARAGSFAARWSGSPGGLSSRVAEDWGSASADFGGNGTAVAASANVVAIGIAARTGHPISFWAFTRYGIVVTVLSTTLAWAYVWLRYFL